VCLFTLSLTAGGDSPDELMQVMMPVIDNEICNQPTWYMQIVDDSMMCAGYEEGERSNCQVSAIVVISIVKRTFSTYV